MITRYHAKYYAQLLTQQSAGDQLTSISQSLMNASVDINPHQIDAALFAFRSPLSKGVVLADEVGLGKTIEAGLVLCQYWATGKRKIIIVAPAALRKQWGFELDEKFGIPNEILDTKNYNQYRREGRNPFADKRVIICSYNFAGKHKSEIILQGFDLAVIDEAHKLRNVYRKSARTAADVRDALANVKKLLLTATPFQNSLLELYGLTSVIDEHVFGSEKTFRNDFGSGQNLAILRDRIAPFFTRTLRKNVKEYINYTHRLPFTQKFNTTDDEYRLYQSISEFLRRDDIYSVPAQQKKLTTMIIRKILASSIFALISTLHHILDRLQRMRDSQQVVDVDVDSFIDDIDIEDIFIDDADEGTMAADDSEIDYCNDQDIDIDKLKAEIETIKDFIHQAEAIKKESKVDALLSALKTSFKKLEENGANHKALIFTESTKTQEYLYQVLEQNGYEGRIVLFNGKASEPQTNAIYQSWCAQHPDKMSGIKAADRRAAIVDYFRDEADIMIATEAAAEGLNLQFCSLLLNYDLPWNPQRIEQRIGRCHRYGQKHDVVVVNFINTRNYADVRVFDLLSTKFKLFDDVFGASDEVLGRADSIDIETRIWQIYQQCRTEEEIRAAFDELQQEMQEEIDQRMDEVRSEVLENFDIDVQERLRLSQSNANAFLNRYQHIFWELTKYVLSKQAVFDDEHHIFRLRVPVAGCKTGKYEMLSQQRGDGIQYRLSCPLGQYVINTALSYNLSEHGVVEFDANAMEMNVNLPDYLDGAAGYLILSQLSVSSFEKEQYCLFTAFTDNGRYLTQEDCEKLFLYGGMETDVRPVPHDLEELLTKNVEQHSKAKIKTLDERNMNYFKQEEEKIFAWEKDMLEGLEQEISTVKKAILQTERDLRNATNIADRIALERKLDEQNRRKKRLRRDLEDREDEISSKRRDMLAEIEKKLIQSTHAETVFIIRWQVK